MIGRRAVRNWPPGRVFGLAVIVFLAACSKPPPDTATGAALLQPFKAEMKQALQAGLTQGPIEAIDVCRVRAPEIAAALSQDGVLVGRASHRLRNPSNAVPDWAADLWASALMRASPPGFSLRAWPQR